MNIEDNIGKFFEEGGLLSEHFEGYEYRRQQVEMSNEIVNQLTNSAHLMIEAPTGIGKSFAYLVPSIYFARENKRKVIISTYTINLQEQLIEKDIPLLNGIHYRWNSPQDY